MIMLNEEGKFRDGSKARSLKPKSSCECKEKFLKKLVATSVNTQMIRKQNRLLADLTLLSSVKAETGAEAAKDKFKAARGWFVKLKERSHLHDRKVQREAVSADVEASPSHPGIKQKEFMIAVTLNNRFSAQVKQSATGRRCHLGLS